MEARELAAPWTAERQRVEARQIELSEVNRLPQLAAPRAPLRRQIAEARQHLCRPSYAPRRRLRRGRARAHAGPFRRKTHLKVRASKAAKSDSSDSTIPFSSKGRAFHAAG